MTRMRWTLLVAAIIWSVVIIGYFFKINVTEDNIYSDFHNKRVRTMDRAPIIDGSPEKIVLAFTNSRGKRIYPLGEAAAHAVGYISPVAGSAGAESMFAEKLTSPVSKRVYFFQDSKKNEPLMLSIDAKLQLTADKALGSEKGAIIVIDLKTGGIIVMVSHPTFNPNLINDIYKRINVQDGPLFNRSLYGFYSPGSVWKIISIINLIDRQDKYFECKGTILIGDRIHRCAYSHGRVGGLKDAFARSCNLYFIQRGINEIKKDDFLRTSKLFMGKPITNEFTAADYIQAIIGQGIVISPLEGCLLAATIANNGMKPETSLLRSTAPAKSQKILSSDDAQFLQVYMSEVVSSGTGKGLLPFQKTGFSIGVKTGTAEKEIGGLKKINDDWIIGYAGKNAPEIAFAVLVENTNLKAAEACTPVIYKVLERYFQKQHKNFGRENTK